jgi:hypothetical protein
VYGPAFDTRASGDAGAPYAMPRPKCAIAFLVLIASLFCAYFLAYSKCARDRSAPSSLIFLSGPFFFFSFFLLPGPFFSFSFFFLCLVAFFPFSFFCLVSFFVFVFGVALLLAQKKKFFRKK